MDAETHQTLSHYRLVEKIGEGGMGVVWKAEDTILNRTVAIKVLPADRTLDERRRGMFLDEARLAASVSHSHIVQVHELGREGDIDFIVMEYVKGEPLNRVMGGRRLPPERVAGFGHQIALGLARAHKAGLVHRDLKPANIIVTPDDDVKIIDFGLASLAARPASTVGQQTTTVSVEAVGEHQDSIQGTMPYMSPEQVKGDKLDSRSDIYSLGIVIYEMTTGQRPFKGPSYAELASEILRSTPRPVHELVPDVPLDLKRIIEKTLAKRPADRYQFTEDVAIDLRKLSKDLESGSSPSYRDIRPPVFGALRRWIVVSAIVVAFAAAGSWVWLQRAGNRGESDSPVHTVLVLPMEFLGQDDGGGRAGRAIAEAMAINLAQAKGLTVLPVPQALDEGRGGRVDPSGLARRLGADLVLTGSVLREGKSLKATVTAIDSRRNRILVGTHETADDGDLSRIASTTSRYLVSQLGITQPKRYDYFRYVSSGPELAKFPGLPEAIAALRRHDVPAGLAATGRLIEAFPNDYDAHAMRLIALLDAVAFDNSEPKRRAVLDEVRTLARIDPKTPLVDLFPLRSSEDPGANLVRKKRLLLRDDLTPAFRSHVLRERATILQSMDSTDAALASMEEALRLDPANPFNYSYLAGVLSHAGRRDEASERWRQAIALDPWFANPSFSPD